MNEKRKNILIRSGYVIYNTENVYDIPGDKHMVKIPSYLIDEVIRGNKTLLIKKSHEKNLALYTVEQLKKKLITVESKNYFGVFKNEQIKYNLTHIEV